MRFKDFLETQGIITAHNPHGRKASGPENAAANAELARDLQDLNPKTVLGTWNNHPEKSFLIPKVGLDRLLELGKKYRQQAVVWGGRTIKIKDD